MAPIKYLGILLLLLIFLKNVHSGEAKKTIKIHVPYYVKHIHHYKKVYVPKVQVVKHEHLHKKEHEHRHFHDHHGHHGYDKSSDGGYLEDTYDNYYDEFDQRNFNNRLAKSRARPGARGAAGQDKWRGRSEEESASVNSGSSEEDYYERGASDDGVLPVAKPTYRYRPRPVPPTFRKTVKVRGWSERSDLESTPQSIILLTSTARLPLKLKKVNT